jgi:zinc and cadmium transporter
MNDLLFYSLIGGLFSLIGGALLLLNEKLTQHLMTPLIAFGAGAFLGAAFLDILPEAIEQAPEAHPIFIAVLVGFISFFILERLIMRLTGPHGNEGTHSAHTESLPFLLILGDCLHNFLDGIVIAIAYVASPAIGFPTALAIAAHEIPQEIGDFAILLSLKWSRKKIIVINILQSLLTIPGVFLGLYLGHLLQPYIVLLLGGAAGVFIYIAASDLIPELHHRAGHKHVLRVVLPLILSVILIYYFTSLAHGH